MHLGLLEELLHSDLLLLLMGPDHLLLLLLLIRRRAGHLLLLLVILVRWPRCLGSVGEQASRVLLLVVLL